MDDEEVLGLVAVIAELLAQLDDDLVERARGAGISGLVLRRNSGPEQAACEVSAYLRMRVWALGASSSRRRA